MIKQVIIVRKDLGMTAGKIASQVAHASLSAFLKTENLRKEIAQKWLEEGQTKIVLKVKDKEEFDKIKDLLRQNNIDFVVIVDSGKTQILPNTETAIGIGPIESEKIDPITEKLKLL
ncbi:MAG: peptidyl-tRNA hydrolase Pth2 [Candidatus Rehaiarchaeum fermentans]|nr:peptidyl-tRNA hydrolase Pth2 [Candidatus Rehaiarchaeum fermentans]